MLYDANDGEIVVGTGSNTSSCRVFSQASRPVGAHRVVGVGTGVLVGKGVAVQVGRKLDPAKLTSSKAG